MIPNKLTVLILAKTLARKCNSPFRFLEALSPEGSIETPSTNASMRSGKARVSCGSPGG
jgi:hypothetical protein